MMPKMIKPIYAILFIGLFLSGISLPAAGYAQTRFQWANSNFDVSEYQYLEKCFAMATRVNDSVENRSDEHPSTRHWRTFGPSSSYHETVRSAVAKCLSKDNFKDHNWVLSSLLYRISGLEENTYKVINDRLNQIPPDSTYAFANVVDTAIRRVFVSRPVNLDAVRPWIAKFFTVDSLLPAERRAATLTALLMIADDQGDLQLIKDLDEKAQKLMVGINFDTLAGTSKRQFRTLARQVVNIRYRDSLLNALSNNTESYREIFNDLSRKAYPDLYSDGWESTISTIENINARFWYPQSENISDYPRPGKVTLFVGLPSGSYREIREAIVVSHVNRLKEKFPAIDVILNFKTRGHFGPLEPPTPEEEGVLADSLWLRFHGISALLVVEETPFWRLPSLDRRRIDEMTENDRLAEEISISGMAFPGSYTLIDQDGKALLLDNTPLPSQRYLLERDIEGKIEALLKRNKK